MCIELIFTIAALMTSLWAPHSAAGASPTKEVSPSPKPLSEMNLEDLMELEVTSSIASKTKRSGVAAPGMVTVWTASDIERFGYYNIAELAALTPGYAANQMYGNSYFSTRGLTVENSYNNNKHIMLIDGVPVNHVRSNSAIIDPQLNLFFADRVEFLRGPASALYGTSAFYGVINIVPMAQDEPGSAAEMKLSAGDWNANKRAMARSFIRTEEGETDLSFAAYDQRNGTQTAIPGSHAPSDSVRDRDSDIFAYLRHRIVSGPLVGTSLGLIYMRRNDGMYEFWDGNQKSNQMDDITWQEIIPYVKYNHAFSPRLTLNAFAKVNLSKESAQFPNVYQGEVESIPTGSGQRTNASSGYNALSNGYEAQVEFSGKELFSQVDWIAGVDVDFRQELGRDSGAWDQRTLVVGTGGPNPNLETALWPDFASTSPWLKIYSLYGQAESKLNLLSGLTVTAGLRLDSTNYIDRSSTQFSPRLGLVQKFAENWGMKVLFSTALRAPTLKEENLKVVRQGEVVSQGINQAVRPEVIRTLELGPSYQDDHLFLQAAAFVTVVKDEIVAAPLETAGPVTNQTGLSRAHGAELDTRFIWSDALLTFGTVSVATSTKPNGEHYATVPNFNYALGASYRLGQPIDFISSLVFKGVARYQTDATAGLEADPSRPVKGWNLVDLNFLARLNRTIGIELQIRNLFDSTIYLPYQNTAAIPMPGRNFLATLSLTL